MDCLSGGSGMLTDGMPVKAGKVKTDELQREDEKRDEDGHAEGTDRQLTQYPARKVAEDGHSDCWAK
mgnify:CR=1 FL=1